MISSEWKHLLSLISGIWKCQNETTLAEPQACADHVPANDSLTSTGTCRCNASWSEGKGSCCRFIAPLLRRICVWAKDQLPYPVLRRLKILALSDLWDFQSFEELLPHSCSLVALNNCSSHLPPLRISWPPQLPTSTPFPSFPFPASMSHVQTACRSQNLWAAGFAGLRPQVYASTATALVGRPCDFGDWPDVELLVPMACCCGLEGNQSAGIGGRRSTGGPWIVGVGLRREMSGLKIALSIQKLGRWRRRLKVATPLSQKSRTNGPRGTENLWTSCSKEPPEKRQVLSHPLCLEAWRRVVALSTLAIGLYIEP